jgi:hypothetical protein
VVRPFLVCSVALLLAAPAARAQAPTATPNGPKSVRAVRAPSPLVVDGVLDEPAWSAAEVVSDFVQQEPRVNEPVSERTEVRVLFDDEALYFGVRCFDSNPKGIVARERRRDNPLTGDDRFEIVLDTFHDHRNGYYFVINPLGTQFDALITDEGQDLNVEWDERWWSETRIDTDGWSAEIKLPLTSLRSAPGTDTFGINFKRFIRRKNEIAQWTAWDRDFVFYQVSQAGHLTGVGNLRTGLRLRVKPYLLGGLRREAVATGGGGTTGSRLGRVGDAGFEVLKFSLTSGLTAELTANTDFAQTEVDEAVVNLTRFPLFFPEKREFFLERAGIFDFGPGGRRGGQTERNLQMFFSRRIGLTEDRRPVPVLGGGRLVGHAGGLDLGVLSVQTGRFDRTAGSHYTVVRAKRNVFTRSNVGAFFSNRQTSRTDYNRVIGADASFTFFKNTDVAGFLSKSATPGRRGDQYAGRAKFNWFSDLYEVFLEHLYVGPQFQHDVGFTRRHDIQRTDAAFIWEPRPGVLDIRNLVFRNELVYTTDTRGRLLTREQIFQATSRFQSDDAVRFNVTGTFDRLDRPFGLAPRIVVPPGDYRFVDHFGELELHGGRRLAGAFRYGFGDFYGGRRRYVRVTPAYRPAPALSVETSYEVNDIVLPQGALVTRVVNARANVNLSNRWLTTTLVQYDSASRRQVVFFRLNFIHRPGDDVFIVFNRTSERGAGTPAEYTVLVKFTYSVDF